MSRRKGITFVRLSHLVFVENAHPEERSFTDLVGGPLIYSSSQVSPLASQLATSPASWGALASSPSRNSQGAVLHLVTAQQQ